MEAEMMMPEKPDNSSWTDDQWEAIVAEGSNILVAAAAGSGKTAVLVERIIRKISSDTDVDRLLVATFTKAAAAEMKERIRIALEKELERQPESEHLRRQLALMGRASITTLHSFCLDVIRRYYPLIGLDPGFRIANETESELMRLEVLDELFEDMYRGVAENSGAFLMLADKYGGERGDEPLYHLVLQLYDFAQSHPWPEHWLRETARAFQVSSAEQLETSEWIQSLRGDLILNLEGAISLLEQALALAKMPAGPSPYADTLDDEIAMLDHLLATVRNDPWSKWELPFKEAAFGRLKALKGDEYDKSLQEQAKELRDSAKKLLSGIVADLFGRDTEQFVSELSELAPLMSVMSELVIAFGSRFETEKRRKGLLDFGDLEHYCLRILRDPSSGPEGLIPSVAALDYQGLFDEILLDEYQDTNMVQEAIVSLIERKGGGNRFMVGDVKQSIYRFRLAEPNLFLAKYKAYRVRPKPGEAEVQSSGNVQDGTMLGTASQGRRIDLARNFRSRQEVVDGVNGVFRAIMREQVAEMDYDAKAELVCGASYPAHARPGDCDVQLAVLNRGEAEDETGDDMGGDEAEDVRDGGDAEAENVSELKVAQLEARWIAAQLRDLLDKGYMVFDGKKRAYRAMQWRDVVILLRATGQWSPILIEELGASGIPAYAELSSGYFEAIEVETMLSLLRIIDNPYQDIPLAAALRSPLFSLTAEELARIRVHTAGGSYYEAVRHAAGEEAFQKDFRLKLSRFLSDLDGWREEARQGSLADLLWRIYRDTGYYDLIGGLPGGAQRQANLRALHDRARQYEATSFRGLFRFLRFIERMRDSGGDLGTARSLGEQEDVVRIMSIHKSKGLEFPVVFVAGLGKTFNQQDTRSSFLKHKTLGFGPRHVDTELRMSYPTLPFLAIKRKLKMELLAEEMRILYVALTRPKEKMFLVGTVRDAEKAARRWSSALDKNGNITDLRIASARSFLDWLGPLSSPQLAEAFEQREEAALGFDFASQSVVTEGTPMKAEQAVWKTDIFPASLLTAEAAAAVEDSVAPADMKWRADRLQAITSLVRLDDVPLDTALRQVLEWKYPYRSAEKMPAKTSVTELKRLHAGADHYSAPLEEESVGHHRLASDAPPGTGMEGDNGGGDFTFRLRRPSFMGEKALTAAEKGSASHLFMQHVPLDGELNESVLRDTLNGMVGRQILTLKQSEAVHLRSALAFFESEVGRRLMNANWVRREVPFSCMLPAGKVYPKAEDGMELEPIMIQGVVDCLFQDENGIVLVDYKTDRIQFEGWEAAAERHRFQLQLYADAIEAALGTKVDEIYLYFFDGSRLIRV